MNREIKFMAWDLEKRELFRVYDIVFYPGADKTGMDGELSKDNKSPSLYFGDGRAAEDNGSINLEQAKLMQFTGLRDKNGNDIYEGHIIQNGGFIGEVFYNPDFDLSGNACAFMIRNRYKIYSFHKMLVDFGMSNLEIIGCIYENPEVMGEIKAMDKFLFE